MYSRDLDRLGHPSSSRAQPPRARASTRVGARRNAHDVERVQVREVARADRRRRLARAAKWRMELDSAALSDAAHFMGILKRARAPSSAAGDVECVERAVSSAHGEAAEAEGAVAGDGAGEQVVHYAEFHARVDAVFGASTATAASTSAVAWDGLTSRDSTGVAWRPRSSAVVRRGVQVGDGDGSDADGSDGSDDKRGADAKVFSDDLDCLESDEDGDDDVQKMARLRASVGRCRTLNDEDEFDDIDAVACGTSAFADDVRDARRRAIASAQPTRGVPDHIAHPERYTRYELDEPLVVGGGASVSSRAVPEPTPNTPDARFESAPLTLTKPTFVATKKRKTTTTAHDSSMPPPLRVKIASIDVDDAVEDAVEDAPSSGVARRRNLRKRG